MLSTQKFWHPLNDYDYELRTEHTVIATFRFHPYASGTKAEVNTGYYLYTIRRVGFWNSTIVISDGFNNELLKAYPDQWMANSFRVNLSGKVLRAEIVDAPTAVLVIRDEHRDILTYCLDRTSSRPTCRMNDPLGADLLLHMLSWFVYLPVVRGSEQPWLHPAAAVPASVLC